MVEYRRCREREVGCDIDIRCFGQTIARDMRSTSSCGFSAVGESSSIRAPVAKIDIDVADSLDALGVLGVRTGLCL